MGSVWNCLWGHALEISPGINRKSRLLYQVLGFLSSSTWPSMPKKQYNGLITIINHQFYSQSSTGYHYNSIELSVRWCVWKDVPHQWIAQRQVGPLSVHAMWRDGVSCPVSVAWHSCVAAHWSKYHCYKQAPSRYDLRCLKATLNPIKQTNNLWPEKANLFINDLPKGSCSVH